MGIDFMSLLKEKKDPNNENNNEDNREHQKLTISNSFDGSETFSTNSAIRTRTRTISSGIEGFEVLPLDDNDDEFDETIMPKNGKKKMKKNSEVKLTEEQYQRGSIKWKVYAEYLKAGSGIISLTVTIVFLILSQTIFSGSDIFLTAWTNKNQDGAVSDAEQHHDIIIYSILVGSLFITTI
ncbi:hypothetical protein BLA29_011285, partial [Euroglyphus maynei]